MAKTKQRKKSKDQRKDIRRQVKIGLKTSQSRSEWGLEQQLLTLQSSAFVKPDDFRINSVRQELNLHGLSSLLPFPLPLPQVGAQINSACQARLQEP